MKGFAYTLDLMLATSILLFVLMAYFSLSSEQIKYEKYGRKAYYLDSYMLGLITSAEKSNILNNSVSNSTILTNLLEGLSVTKMGPETCIYVKVYNSTNFYSDASPIFIVHKPGCDNVAENSRIYYRHVYVQKTPPEFYVFKFYAWYK